KCRRMGPVFRYGLRTLFAVLILLAMAVGWLGTEYRHGRQRQAALKAVHEAGGEFQARSATLALPAWLSGWLGDDFFVDAVSVDLGRKEQRAYFEEGDVTYEYGGRR